MAFLKPESALVHAAEAIPALAVIEAWEQGRDLPSQTDLKQLREMSGLIGLEAELAGIRR